MIFGTLHSKFEYDNLGTTETVDLYYSAIKPEYYIPEQVEHRSIINGNINYVNPTHHSAFIVTVYLWKYGTVDAKAKYAEIMSYKDSLVSFYPHSDGVTVKDEFSVDVPFKIKKIVPYSIENLSYYDAVDIYFDSTKHADLVINLEGFGYNYGEDFGTGL